MGGIWTERCECGPADEAGGPKVAGELSGCYLAGIGGVRKCICPGCPGGSEAECGDAADLRRAAAGDSPGTVGAAAEAARSFRDAALRLAESVGAAYRAEAAALDAVAPPPYA